MKKLPFALVLMLSLIIGSSFTGEDEEIITDEAVLFQIKNGYAIRIDGFGFDAREKNSVTAHLTEKNSNITTSLTFGAIAPKQKKETITSSALMLNLLLMKAKQV